MPSMTQCQFPGCTRPAEEPTAETGRRPAYCDDPDHNRETAYRERRRLEGEGVWPPIDVNDPHERPVSMATTSLAVTLDTLTTRAGELRELADRVEDAAATITDPAALELELDAARASADLQLSQLRADAMAQQQQDAALARGAQAELEAERQRAAALSAEAATTKEALERCQAELDEARRGLVAAQEQAHERDRAHERAIGDLRAQLDGERAELVARVDEISRLQDDAAASQSAYADLEAQVARVGHELDAAREGLAAAREQAAGERAAREAAEAAVADARAVAEQTAHTAQELVAAERARAEDARQAVQDIRDERERLVRANARLEDRVTGLEALVDASRTSPADAATAKPKRTSRAKPRTDKS